MDENLTTDIKSGSCTVPVKLFFSKSLDIDSMKIYVVMKTFSMEDPMFDNDNEWLSKKSGVPLEDIEKHLKALFEEGFIRTLHDHTGKRLFIEILPINYRSLIRLGLKKR